MLHKICTHGTMVRDHDDPVTPAEGPNFLWAATLLIGMEAVPPTGLTTKLSLHGEPCEIYERTRSVRLSCAA